MYNSKSLYKYIYLFQSLFCNELEMIRIVDSTEK